MMTTVVMIPPIPPERPPVGIRMPPPVPNGL